MNDEYVAGEKLSKHHGVTVQHRGLVSFIRCENLPLGLRFRQGLCTGEADQNTRERQQCNSRESAPPHEPNHLAAVSFTGSVIALRTLASGARSL